MTLKNVCEQLENVNHTLKFLIWIGYESIVKIWQISDNMGKRKARTYVCDDCNSKFTRPAHLKKHLAKMNKSQVYKCEICETTLYSIDCLVSHARQHGEEYVQKVKEIRHCDQFLDELLDLSPTNGDFGGSHILIQKVCNFILNIIDRTNKKRSICFIMDRISDCHFKL